MQTLKYGSATHGATVFAYQVKNPERFGVAEFNENFRAVSIEENRNAQIRLGGNGRYFYDNRAVESPTNQTVCTRRIEITDQTDKDLKTARLRSNIGTRLAWLTPIFNEKPARGLAPSKLVQTSKTCTSPAWKKSMAQRLAFR